MDEVRQAAEALLTLSDTGVVNQGVSASLATVKGINPDGSLNIQLDGSTGTLTVDSACSPLVGDRVIVMKARLARGTYWVAVSVIGGDAVYSLGLSKAIRLPHFADIDTYFEPGTYITQSAAHSATIVNSPGAGYISAGAVLIVDQTGMWNASRTTQTWRPSNRPHRDFTMRHSEDGASWSEWVKWSSEYINTHTQNLNGLSIQIHKVGRVCDLTISGAVTTAFNVAQAGTVATISSAAFRPLHARWSVAGYAPGGSAPNIQRYHIGTNGAITLLNAAVSFAVGSTLHLSDTYISAS